MRQAAVVSLMMYCLLCGKWASFEFFGGLFLAELSLLKRREVQDCESSEFAWSPPRRRMEGWKVLRNGLQLSLIAWSLFIGGWPNWEPENTPGIRWYIGMTPEAFLRMTGRGCRSSGLPGQPDSLSGPAVILAPSDDSWRTQFAQYCGRISFAVYIVHGPVLALIQSHIVGNVPRQAEGLPNTPEFSRRCLDTGLRGSLEPRLRCRGHSAGFSG